MAAQRKTFRPRHLVFGASFVLVASLLPAFAEDVGLKNGAAALTTGKYDNAVRMLSSTINSDNASQGEAAKALYLRGIAYRKLGQPSRAIADLGAAIFLGLPDQDRVGALVNRGLAYQAAGLSAQGDAEIALARKAGGSGAVEQLIAEGGGAPRAQSRSPPSRPRSHRELSPMGRMPKRARRRRRMPQMLQVNGTRRRIPARGKIRTVAAA